MVFKIFVDVEVKVFMVVMVVGFQNPFINFLDYMDIQQLIAIISSIPIIWVVSYLLSPHNLSLHLNLVLNQRFLKLLVPLSPLNFVHPVLIFLFRFPIFLILDDMLILSPHHYHLWDLTHINIQSPTPCYGHLVCSSTEFNHMDS